MEFTNTPMEWNNAGTEPPESLKNNGWEANQKPPANYFNKKWHNDYKVQKELQEAINTLDETVSKTSEEFMLNKDNWSAGSGENSTYCQVVTLSNYEPTDKVLVSIKHNIVKSQLKDISEKNFRVNALSSAGALTLYIDDLPTTHIYILVSYLGKCTGGSLAATFPYTPYPTKELVGLGNVDNTSDLNKPVSAAVQSALNGRLPFGICTTPGNNNNKTVTIPNYTVTSGSWFCLVFTESNTASSAYLTVNGVGSLDIYFGDTGQLADITANTLYLVYLDDIDGTYYFTDLSVETSPSQGSTSLITSGGVYSALAGKASASHSHSANDIDSGTLPVSRGGTGNSSVDTTPTSGSTKMVTSGGVYNALNGKANTSHSHALADLPKGTDGFILTGTGADTSPTWEAPLFKRGDGLGSVIRLSNTAAATADGDFAASLGYSTKAQGDYSAAFNWQTTASGNSSAAFGTNTTASGNNSAAFGYGTEAMNYQVVAGKYNVVSEGATSHVDTTGDIFIVGVGTGESARANAFRITTSGDCYGKSSFKASGADFAEFFEWVDGNPDDEDRRGLFVTLDGEKIRLANANDEYILGAVSAVPTITGDTHSETWKNMYLTDVFGAPLTETIEVDETTNEQGVVIPAHTETRFIVNPEYDNEQKYISRDKRKEWAAVGLVGKLVVVDDGSCIENGFCKPTTGGVATKSDTGYRVISRIDDSHIKVVIK